jgi:C-terminal processing protease CtpA/Prc
MRGLNFLVLVALASMGPPAFAETKAVPTASASSLGPEAKAYIDEAIALFRKSHINAGKMDWPALTAKAYAAVAGARTPRDTYPAIQLIIKELGEKHTVFLDPDTAKAQSTGVSTSTATAPPLMLTEVAKLANGVGLVRLYGFTGSDAWARQYVEHGRSRIAGLQAEGVCRFILDLRSNTGGNMYPMLSALSPLLDDGNLGKFEYADGHMTYWGLKDGEASETKETFAPVAPKKAATLPVAVLLGQRTASSGEFTAMSFKGRANTRFFGSPTAGYVTGNDPVKLSDGAMILMTDGWGIDRTGRKYVDVVLPDEDTGYGGPTLDAATDWLMRQGCN